MLERLHTGDYRTTPFDARQPEPREFDREDDIPLYLSDSDGEPQPDEYISLPSPERRRLSISSRILAAVCLAAAAAVLFALFSSDAMRNLVNVKAATASVASILPAPSVAAPSPAPLPAPASWKDPARLGSPANKAPGAPVIAMANVTPSREEMRSAYQSAWQSQAPVAVAAAEPPTRAQPQIQTQMPVQAPVGAPHRIDPDEIAAALKRAGAMMVNRDIAAARLILQRVANDGDGQAAVMLAESYDPAILEKLGVYGMAPDVAMARQWYETAQRLGSTEASQRLALLAGTNR